MSRNTLRARLDFSFKAETHELDACIDLDPWIGTADEGPNFHLLLAKACGIDPYSYLYEVLESYEIEFTEATGIAAQCCSNGEFDWSRFEQLSLDDQDAGVVAAIAERIMGVKDLEAHAELKEALLVAYRAGKTSRAA